MGQKYAAYDAAGVVFAFYDDEDSPVPSDTPAIEITHDQWQAAISGGYAVVDGVLTAPVPPTKAELKASAKEQAPALIAAARYAHETGGIAINGMQIDTGRDSQALITGAALGALIDSAVTVNWKTTDGWVKLDAPTVIAIAQAVRAHVQACFDREATLVAMVADDTYAESMLAEGWPVTE